MILCVRGCADVSLTIFLPYLVTLHVGYGIMINISPLSDYQLPANSMVLSLGSHALRLSFILKLATICDVNKNLYWYWCSLNIYVWVCNMLMDLDLPNFVRWKQISILKTFWLLLILSSIAASFYFTFFYFCSNLYSSAYCHQQSIN